MPELPDDLAAAGTFAWALGIEDTFIPQLAPGGRVLDEYVLTQHDRFWRDDLRRIADTGCRHLRYGIPWYRVNPAPGEFDWSWTDEVLPYLVQELGIAPILDLVHYGAPTWLDGTFLSPDYPGRVAEYAAAVARRYGSLVRSWTPLNEPLLHAHFAGRTGTWPPHRRGGRGHGAVACARAGGARLRGGRIRAGGGHRAVDRRQLRGGSDRAHRARRGGLVVRRRRSIARGGHGRPARDAAPRLGPRAG